MTETASQRVLDYSPEERGLRFSAKTVQAVLLLLILALAGLLRFNWIEYPSHEMDELWHVELATGRGSAHLELPRDVLMPAPVFTRLEGAPPWYAVWTNMGGVTHPPLYPLLLRLWGEVFGMGDRAVRSFSAVVSVLSVLLLFDLARQLHGRSIALWGSLIMALAGAQISMSQQARGYSLLVLWALVAAGALVRIERRGGSVGHSVVLGAGVLGMMLTHYFGLGVAVALAVYAALRLGGAARRGVAISFAASALVFLLIWGPWLWEQRYNVHETADNWLVDDSPGQIGRAIGHLAVLPLRLMFEPQEKSYPVVYLAAIFYIIPLVMLRRRRDLLLWMLWIGGTIGFVAMLDLLRSTWQLALVRYTFLASPAIYMILASLMAHRRPLLRHGVPAVCALGCLLALEAAYMGLKPDWKGLARYLEHEARPGDVVLFHSSDEQWWANAMCLAVTHYAQSPPPMMLLTDPAQGPVLESIRSARGVWLVAWTSEPTADLLPGYRMQSSIFIPGIGTCQYFTLAGDA